MGPIAKPESISVVPKPPKTRCGKIMRRVLKAKALGQPVGDTSTIEEQRGDNHRLRASRSTAREALAYLV